MRRYSGLFLLVIACAGRMAEVDRTEFGFGSYVRIEALGPDKAKLDRAVQAAFTELFRLDTLWSSFLPGSEASFLNRSGGTKVSAETRRLVGEALGVCRNTGGALDITVRPLLHAWGIIGGHWRVPDSAELALDRRLVDYRRVRLGGDSVMLGEGTQIDLGAVAVGFAVDRAVEILKSAGVRQGLVDASGDIRVFGDRVWRIGLRNPRGEGVLRVFSVKDRAITTSGDYEKFFESGGRRCCHIIDPATGYPADKCCSVTVLAPTAFAADAYATAIFVLGPDRGLEAAKKEDGMGVVVLVDGKDSLETHEWGIRE